MTIVYTDKQGESAQVNFEQAEVQETKDSEIDNKSIAGESVKGELDFGCEYTDNLPLILKELNISLAVTSYQTGRLIIVRSDGESIDVNFKSFQRPMGLAATEDGLTLGTFTEIVHFQREDGLLEKIKQPLSKIEDDITAPRIKPKETSEKTAEPQAEELEEDDLSEKQKAQRAQLKAEKENAYLPVDEGVDACFISRSVHYSGMINIHDIDWGDEGLWVVNSSFSCLCTIEPDHSFIPRWKPHFISELKPEDRCHLNGMTLKDGKPAYVTTFSQEDKAGMWRTKDGKFNGTLMAVASNEILLDGLAMPHSPRWYNDKVYFCNSGHGHICSYEPDTKTSEILAEVPGFTRGMDFYGPIMFVGLSKVRQGDVTRPAPLAQKYDETFSGIWLMNINDESLIASSGKNNAATPENTREIAHLKFTGNVDQIYDIAVIPNCNYPEIIEPSHPRLRNHFSHPELRPLNNGNKL